jgi:hypothetical protein
MTDRTGRLRFRTYKINGVEITVNVNYRTNVGYRATIKGKQGAFCDSEHSPEEALGNLFVTWLAEETRT